MAALLGSAPPSALALPQRLRQLLGLGPVIRRAPELRGQRRLRHVAAHGALLTRPQQVAATDDFLQGAEALGQQGAGARYRQVPKVRLPRCQGRSGSLGWCS